MTDTPLSRRDFLKAGCAAGAAALLGDELRSQQPARPQPTADAIDQKLDKQVAPGAILAVAARNDQ